MDSTYKEILFNNSFIGKQKTHIHIDNVKVNRRVECGTDHMLVTAKVIFPYKASTLLKENSIGNCTNNNLEQCYNLESLYDNLTEYLYKLRLSKKLTINNAKIQAFYVFIKTAIHEAAQESLENKHFKKPKIH